MKSAWLKISLVILVLAAITYGLYRYYNQDKVDWTYTLSPEGEEPYGLDIFMNLMENRTDSSSLFFSTRVPHWTIEDPAETFTFYIERAPYPSLSHLSNLDSLVHEGAHLVNFDLSGLNLALWHFMATGDTSLISYQTYYGNNGRVDTSALLNYFNEAVVSERLFNQLIPCDSVYLKWNETGSIGKFAYTNDLDTVHGSMWTEGYIHKSILDTLFPEVEITSHVLGSPENVTSWKIKRGRGYVHFFTAACVFTNYALINKENFPFTRDFLSSLPEGYYFQDYFRPPYEYEQNRPELTQSPLSFILSYPTLRWAWYLLLISLIVFLIFKAQRRQRIVPILPRVTNQSLEFSKSLGVLRFKANQTHDHVVTEIFRQFSIWAKRRFRTTGVMDTAFKEQLIQLLPNKKADIEMLFYLHKKNETSPENITSEDLHRIYVITRYIYDHV